MHAGKQAEAFEQYRVKCNAKMEDLTARIALLSQEKPGHPDLLRLRKQRTAYEARLRNRNLSAVRSD